MNNANDGRIDRDDPRLTAYALGEMDPGERAAFEALLAKDPPARAEVEAIRALGTRLEQDLASEPLPALLEPQRERLTGQAARPRPRLLRGWMPALATAAGVLLALGVYAVLQPEAVVERTKTAEEVAREREARARSSGARSSRLFEGPAPVSGLAREGTSPQPGLYGRDGLAPPPAGGGAGAAVGFREGRDPTPGGATSGSRPVLPAAAAPATKPPSAEEEQPGRQAPFHTEGYDRLRDNPFVRVGDQDTSTFSIDVDTASYANVRRFLVQQNRLPIPDAVRIEELVNYFPYAYVPPPQDAEHPFAAHAVVTGCPWEPKHRLVRVALKGKVTDREQRPAANLVFLLDVSGSMRPANKLPLLKQALNLLVEQLDEGDRVAIVVYAGAAGLVLPSTSADHREEILGALGRLQSGGSTNGGAGIQLAYRIAQESFLQGGVNRVILCTDGDFNVGVSDRGSLTRMIEEKAKGGVFLTILGFGMGNYKDGRMEELSNRGNGNYGYVDTLREARKLLVDEGLSTLVTIAKDVKIQVFFNPKRVAGWRLIGYENRLLRKQDFNDDTKDAGEIGAGHAVTALYEIVPAGVDLPGPKADPNPFVEAPAPAAGAAPETDARALLRLRLRYKAPDGDKSTLMEQDVFDEGLRFGQADVDCQWAAAVAGFGMLLRDSPYKGQIGWDFVEEVARAAVGRDPDGYRAEFLDLVKRAAALQGR